MFGKAFSFVTSRRVAGGLALAGVTAAASIFSKVSASVSPLSPKEFRSYPLGEIIPVTHDTSIYRFTLQPGTSLDLPVASCLVTKANINGKDEIRPYTPISQSLAQGHFDLLVKSYPDGVMSKHFASLKPGDNVEFKGPFEKFAYQTNMKREIGMIAGGTGLTPMLQVCRKILSLPRDATNITLVFCNSTENDILLKSELDKMQLLFPNFKVHYVVSRPSESWRGRSGYIDAELLKTTMPFPSDNHMILVSGPSGFMKHVSGDKNPDKSQGELSGLLKELGYDEKQVFKF